MKWLSGLLSGLCLCGCSYMWDSSAPEVILTGGPADMSHCQRFTQDATERRRSLIDADGAPWLVFLSYSGDQATLANTADAVAVRLVRPGQPPFEESLVTNVYYFGEHAIFWFDPDSALLTLVRHQPGRGDNRIPLGVRNGLLALSEHDDTFVFSASDTHTFLIGNTSSGIQRTIAWPDAELDIAPLLDESGEWLFVLSRDGRVRAYRTYGDEVRNLARWTGVLHGQLGVTLIRRAEVAKALVVCDELGLRTVPYDGSPSRTVDGDPCGPSPAALYNDRIDILYGEALYTSGSEVRMVPLDGSVPPRIVGSKQQHFLGFGRDRAAYRRDLPGRWIDDVSDGWLADWRFMERGRALDFGEDGRALRFIEHAADEDGVGELMSFPAGERVPLLLARNVKSYVSYGPHVVLAAANRAVAGAQNRIIAIDEESRRARSVAEGSDAFELIPSARALVAELVPEAAQAGTLHLAYCPIPLPEAEANP